MRSWRLSPANMESVCSAVQGLLDRSRYASTLSPVRVACGCPKQSGLSRQLDQRASHLHSGSAALSRQWNPLMQSPTEACGLQRQWARCILEDQTTISHDMNAWLYQLRSTGKAITAWQAATGERAAGKVAYQCLKAIFPARLSRSSKSLPTLTNPHGLRYCIR